MRIEESVFSCRSLMKETLEPYGFRRDGDSYRYSEPMLEGAFRAVICIGQDGKVSGTVIESNTEEEYLPVHAQNQTGAFAGRVREAYTSVLRKIAERCFTVDPGKYTKKRVWIIPANPKSYDLDTLFEGMKDVLWKQSSRVQPGDLVFMYITAPVSAVRYQCIVTETEIPYEYSDANVSMEKVMKMDVLKKFPDSFLPLVRLKELGVTAVRGPRTATDAFMEFVRSEVN